MMTELEQVLWIKQVRDFGLGNTITMTPGLREMSARLGQRIPMYFETDGLSQLFADCPFIDVMACRIKHFRAKFTSHKPERLPGDSDYMAWFRILNPTHPAIVLSRTGSTQAKMMNMSPYVDACEPPQWWTHPKGKTVAIIHGCLSDSPATIAQKDVGVEVRQHMVDAVCEAGATPVILGNERDNVRFWSRCNIDRKEVNNDALCHPNISLRRTVGIMQKCDAFITNATGLYHVGAASGTTGLVLWKDCDFVKNVAPSKRVKHSMRMSYHVSEIDKFVKKIMTEVA